MYQLDIWDVLFLSWLLICGLSIIALPFLMLRRKRSIYKRKEEAKEALRYFEPLGYYTKGRHKQKNAPSTLARPTRKITKNLPPHLPAARHQYEDDGLYGMSGSSPMIVTDPFLLATEAAAIADATATETTYDGAQGGESGGGGASGDWSAPDTSSSSDSSASSDTSSWS